MTGKKERRSRFGGMGSVLAQHRLLDTALGPGEGAVDPADAPDAASQTDAAGAPSAPAATAAAAPPMVPDETAPPREAVAKEAQGRATPPAARPAPRAGDTGRASSPAKSAAPSAARFPLPGRRAAPAPPAPSTAPVAPVAAAPVTNEPGATDSPSTTTAEAGARAAGGLVEERPIDEIRPSPFQPQGRPSRGAVDAVGRAIREAGSLDALVSTEGALVFARLDAEAARLAELAFDIAVHGVKDPVVTRVAEDGTEECLSGHRRLAAARLAGLATVPVLSRGPMSNAHAAATVLSGNLHREPFTTWQEAVLVTEVQERRRAEQMPADVRTLSRVMGWASGKAQARLKLRRMLSDTLLTRLDDPALLERIGRLGTQELNRIADTADESRRLALLRRALGVADPAGARPADTHDRVIVQRPRRGGGFVLEVRQEIESMPLGDLALVRELLAAQLARVTTRIDALGHHSSVATH